MRHTRLPHDSRIFPSENLTGFLIVGLIISHDLYNMLWPQIIDYCSYLLYKRINKINMQQLKYYVTNLAK